MIWDCLKTDQEISRLYTIYDDSSQESIVIEEATTQFQRTQVAILALSQQVPRSLTAADQNEDQEALGEVDEDMANDNEVRRSQDLDRGLLDLYRSAYSEFNRALLQNLGRLEDLFGLTTIWLQYRQAMKTASTER